MVVNMGLINEFQKILQYVYTFPEWVVIVCPSDEIVLQSSKIFMALLPINTAFSGRTIVLSAGHKISIIKATDSIFIPEGTPFTLTLKGWNAKDNQQGILQWQNKAAKTI